MTARYQAGQTGNTRVAFRIKCGFIDVFNPGEGAIHCGFGKTQVVQTLTLSLFVVFCLDPSREFRVGTTQISIAQVTQTIRIASRNQKRAHCSGVLLLELILANGGSGWRERRLGHGLGLGDHAPPSVLLNNGSSGRLRSRSGSRSDLGLEIIDPPIGGIEIRLAQISTEFVRREGIGHLREMT